VTPPSFRPDLNETADLAEEVARFGIDFTRFHEQVEPLGLSLTQWIAIALAGAGAILLLRPAPPAKVNPSFAT
jgi:hypothetical protein